MTHQSKRGRLLDALRASGMEADAPGGAYYILARASNLQGDTAAEKARGLLAATGVAAVAGSAFFRPGRGEDLLRFPASPKKTTNWTRPARGCGRAAFSYRLSEIGWRSFHENCGCSFVCCDRRDRTARANDCLAAVGWSCANAHLASDSTRCAAGQGA